MFELATENWEISLAIWTAIVLRIGFAWGARYRRGDDRMRLDRPPPSVSAPPRNVPPGETGDVEAALLAGRKIDAIRILRDSTGLGLKEAKEEVERMERRMRG
ncbi:MAG: ribosomal protein L7/L12 [Novosphingobium sp.]|nr:ribosomal protein L7/L12 [Novosphingobium sp.]